jgi:RHS repeat-associated protein
MLSILNKFMTAPIKCSILAVFMLISMGTYAQFTPEIFSVKRSGVQVKARLSQSGSYTNRIDTVTDNKYSEFSGSTWRQYYKHKTVYDRISISIKDTTKAMQKFDYLFNMTIDTFDVKQRRGSFNVTMRFSYDPASHKAYIDKSVFQFRHCHQYILKINSILDSSLVNPASFSVSTMQTNFVIESEVIVERYWLGPYTKRVKTLSHSLTNHNKLRIQWTAPDSSSPCQYELEWAYTDVTGIHPDSLRYDFLHNSSRILIAKTYYDINAVYDTGVIIYRVRVVRPDSVYYTYNKYGSWYPASKPDKGFIKDYSSGNKVFIRSHEAMGKNWDYQVAFAEQGLKKEVVNYFDGSLKRRQGVTLSNSNNFALVDESIYDFHGREVIKIIPAPSDSNKIRYYKKFNQNAAGAAYSAHDFDSSTVMADKCNGNYRAQPIGTQSGAGRYYSASNPDKTNENAAIPDAQGYPIVQTQLAPDPTGRVEKQGGIGLVQQLGGGHETQYSYNSAKQKELDELFGSETGIAQHYKKNAVIDPNGQTSISYIDQHGRVVATSLSGGVPGMVDTLQNFQRAKYEMTSLANNKFINNSVMVTHAFKVDNAGTHKVFYRLEAPDFTFGCLGLKQCYTCRYKLKLQLADNCGSTLLSFSRPIGRLSDTSCAKLVFNLEDSISSVVGTVSSSGDSISFYLAKGNYTLTKTLQVDLDSIDNKIEAVIAADSSCYKSIGDFIDAEMDSINFDDCACASCDADTFTYCEARRQLMLEDLSPGGQYFTFDPETYLVSDSSSVARDRGGNRLYSTISASLFKNDKGGTDTVWIDGFPWQPRQLAIPEYIEHFKPQWSEALLTLHPEYCYYRACVDSFEASYIYDEAMADIDNYDTAVYYGYLNPMGNRTDITELNNDPLFVNPNGTNKIYFSTFNDKLYDLSDYTFGNVADPLQTGTSTVDLWQFSKATAFCQDIADPLQRKSCFMFYYQDQQVVNNWMNDAAGRDLYWQKFRSMYFQLKHKFIEQRMNNVSGTYCVKTIGPGNGSVHYQDKISHFITYANLMPIPVDSAAAAEMKADLADSLKAFGTCEANVSHWDQALSLCANYSTHRDSILYHLLTVCKTGSSNPLYPNIFGSKDIPAAFAGGQRFKSFDAVLKHFIGNNYKNELCNTDLINAPRSYATDYENNKPSELNDCICERVKSEIKEFKGCYSASDTSELSSEGWMINKFVNLLVQYNRFNDTSVLAMNSGDWGFLADKLFGPLIGGNAGSIKLKLRYSSNWLNERTFTVYNKTIAGTDSCNFSFRLNPNTATFSNIKVIGRSLIKSMGNGVFSYRIYKNDNTSVVAFVYNSCFNDISKCEPTLAASQLSSFTTYFNQKYLSSFTEKDMELMVGQCGAGSIPNVIREQTNTMYLRYGSCPDYYRNYKEPKDLLLVNVLNEMMRPSTFWSNPSAPGYVGGGQDNKKRYLNTFEPNFHCSPNATVDFLTQAKSYSAYKNLIGNKYDNYWWVEPKITVSSFVVGGVTYLDSIWVNNINNDPYFVGGFWIGSRCDTKRDSNCFTSFGDPYKQLGKDGRPGIGQIDSLNHYRWDDASGSYLVTAYDRTHPADSVVLSIKNQCKIQCNPLVRYTEIPVVYKDVFIQPGSGGTSRLSNVKADLGMNAALVNPFTDMLNGLVAIDSLHNAKRRDIRIFDQRFKFTGYYDPLIPAANGYRYKNETVNDSFLIGSVGKYSTDTVLCKFGLRKSGSNRGWAFSDIDFFRNFGPDAEAIAESLKNNQPDRAGYHFTIQAGKINSPGDTSWFPVKGWSSCWKFFELSALSANSKPLFDLPTALSGNCNCLTCPETKKWSDSLRAEYPNLYPGHNNYETIVSNYINRKLNTNISFAEIQTHWDECGVLSGQFIPLPRCDYRLSVKNNDCIDHADTTLEQIMARNGLSFTYDYTKFSDSTEYCLDFSGLTSADILMLQDTLNKYFSAPYCSKFKKRSNYRENYDIILYSLKLSNMLVSNCNKSGFDTWFSSVKTNLFASSANLSASSINNVGFSGAEGTEADVTWMAKIEFSNLTASQRKAFRDTLSRWTSVCGGYEIIDLFYTQQSAGSLGTDNVCLVESGDTTCYTCDTFRQYLVEYQDEVSSAKDMSPFAIETYLEDRTGQALRVYEGASECVGCANKNLYVCEEPSDQVKNFAVLLNKVAKNKKLNAVSYSLNSTYTSLLNAVKPAGTVLNKPKYKYAPNTRGGWSATIKYNTKDSNVIFVNADINDYQKLYDQGIDTFIQLRLIAGHGYVSSFSLNAIDSLHKTHVYNFYIPGISVAKCCAIPSMMLCPQPYTREYLQYEAPCKEEEVAQAVTTGTLLYYSYLDSLKRSMKQNYELHCLSKAKEDMRLGQFKQRYHSTLYYYDQAGNLIKTVPPQGIKELNVLPLQTRIDKHRFSTGDSVVNTWHNMGTSYQYNSLNQLVWQKTPDGGESSFWYDRLGRLVLSQNAVQAAKSGSTQKYYSYTRYDALGRICEVGEISNRVFNHDSMLNTLSYYNFWLKGSLARTQITKTFYDYSVMPLAGAQFSEGQRNLRGRVSSVSYFDAYVADSTKYTRATHYSYDIHGNVDHLVHDFPDMAMVNSRYKHITYNYDLISGKVHAVAYQAGQPDQWHHRYSYDADNRLTLAETSTDSVIWDRDAQYKYYKHGPLARTILGEHTVQGIDYAYTIHGWLKGVNSNTVDASRDIGKDGTGVLRKYTARDAYGFTLGYYNNLTGGAFDGDYQSIGTTTFEASTAGSPLAVTANNMYNGNITHMVSAVGVLLSGNSNSPLATIYKYDQLNRIKSVHTYNGINLTTNSWNSGSQQTAWRETFQYDANGNITKLTRNNKTVTIDNLTYNYKDSNSNQLKYVDDVISSGTVTTDIDDQTAGNYRYDQIGNLTYDRAEKIDSIQWNVYGKITEIKRTAGSGKSDLSFKYDAMGQRVLKIVKPSLLESTWDYTWYVRDAQGNVIATYTKKNKLNVTDTGLYRQINASLISRMNGDSLAAFIKAYFWTTQFKTNLANAIANKNLSDNLAAVYHADTLLAYDNNFAKDVLTKYCTYYTTSTDRNAMWSAIWSANKDSIVAMLRTGCLGEVDIITKVLNADVTSNTFLTAMASYDAGRFQAVYTMLGGSGSPPTNAKITYIRSQPTASAASAISTIFSSTALWDMIKVLNPTILESAFKTNQDFCTMMNLFGGCAYTTVWFNYVRNTISNTVVNNIISQNTEKFYMAGKLIEKDPKVLNKVITLSPALISDALRTTSGLDLTTYLMYVYQRFGQIRFNQVLSDVGTIKMQKTLTLDELHIYGSSRHGINKPKKRIVAKSYVLETIETDGTFDYGAARDSTFAKISKTTFRRTVTYKQYELTNHLGNVLATVLDRKTLVTNSGDTFYSADVSTAGMYYAFGSSMTDLAYTHDTGKYRYGFNGKETDPESGLQDYGFRIYNPGLAKFLSVDPITSDYPWYTPYQFAGNMPIGAIDLDGLEPTIANLGWYTDPWGMLMGMLDEELDGNTNAKVEYKLGLQGTNENGKFTNGSALAWLAYDQVMTSMQQSSGFRMGPMKVPSSKPSNTSTVSSNSRPKYTSTSTTNSTPKYTKSQTTPKLNYTTSRSSKSYNQNVNFKKEVKDAWALDKEHRYLDRGEKLEATFYNYKYKDMGYVNLNVENNTTTFPIYDFYNPTNGAASSFKSWNGNTFNKSIWTGYIDKISETIGKDHKGYQIFSGSLDVVVPNDAAKAKMEKELGEYASDKGVKLNVTVQN